MSHVRRSRRPLQPRAIRARIFYLIWPLALVATLALARGAAAQQFVDQEFTCNDQFFQIQFLMPAWQSFTPAKPNLSAVELYLLDLNLPHTDTVTVNVRAGSIAGPILATRALLVVPPPGTQWVRFDLPSPIAVAPGGTYVIEPLVNNPT